MPATTIVVYERRGAIAERIRAAVPDGAVQIRQTQDSAGFLAALAETPFPIAILDRETASDSLLMLLAEAALRFAAAIVIGQPADWQERLEIWEAGVVAFPGGNPSPSEWRVLLVRLLAQAQERCGQTG